MHYLRLALVAAVTWAVVFLCLPTPGLVSKAVPMDAPILLLLGVAIVACSYGLVAMYENRWKCGVSFATAGSVCFILGEIMNFGMVFGY